MINNFTVNVILTYIALLACGRIIYLLINREAFFRKHKAGTFEYTRAKQLISVRARIIAVIATPLILLSTVLDANSIIHARGKEGIATIESTILFVTLILAAIFIAGYSVFKEGK